MPEQTTFISRLSSLFRAKPAERKTFSESENEFLVGTTSLNTSEFDRDQYSREELLQQCLDAWRFNPLARRIVEIISQHVVGAAFTVTCKDKPTANFIEEFWTHPFNRMDSRLIELCDELTRSGNLFILISSDAGGMSYIRLIPASLILEIKTRSNDVEQELSFLVKNPDGGEPKTYPAYNREDDHAATLQPCVVHYAINRPAGGLWGESDLSPILKWLSRYSAFLDDRVRLNRYRNAFLYVVKSAYSSENTRKARQAQLALNPPTPGSILVTDESETWEILSPKLESADAERDGLSLKKMIASGVGIPLHFLAEPESSTRSTAEASGGPTYRKFQQRQTYFQFLVKDLLSIIISRANLASRRALTTEFEVHPGDLSGRDNVSLAMAGSNITSAFETLYNLGAVSKEEMVRVLYRFIGEEGDPNEIVKAGTGKDLRPSVSTTPNPKQPLKINPDTGEPKDRDL